VRKEIEVEIVRLGESDSGGGRIGGAEIQGGAEIEEN
jgi:hypothetical protein